MTNQRPKRWRAWTIVTIISVLVVVIVAVKVRSLREETQIRICKEHLYEVAFAVSYYNAKHGHLPEAVTYVNGVPMHSWRVLILEVWQPHLFAQYRMTEPWNSPHNSKLASQMPHQYRCAVTSSKRPADHTTFVAVLGSNSVIRTSDQPSRRQEDTPKDAIMLIELPGKPRHWMAPEDASVEEVSAYFDSITPDSGRHEHYATADVRVQSVRDLSRYELADRLEVQPVELQPLGGSAGDQP